MIYAENPNQSPEQIVDPDSFNRVVKMVVDADAVSYTHLTLPTTPYV